MKYRLRLDEYRKGWDSTYYDVEAGNLTEAVSFVLGDDPDHCDNVGTGRWSSATLTVGENGGMATCKVVSVKDNKVVWDNAGCEKRYVKLPSASVKALVGAEGFDDNVFKGEPLNEGDRNIYFVNEEWYEKQYAKWLQTR